MKKANIYTVTVKESTGKNKNITCVATSIADIVDTVAPKLWDAEAKNYKYPSYKDSDILSIILEKQDVLVQNYITDINLIDNG